MYTSDMDTHKTIYTAENNHTHKQRCDNILLKTHTHIYICLCCVQINRESRTQQTKQDDVSSSSHALLSICVCSGRLSTHHNISHRPTIPHNPPHILFAYAYNVNQTRHTQKLSFILINILVYFAALGCVPPHTRTHIHIYLCEHIQRGRAPSTPPTPTSPHTNILRPLHATIYLYATREFRSHTRETRGGGGDNNVKSSARARCLL